MAAGSSKKTYTTEKKAPVINTSETGRNSNIGIIGKYLPALINFWIFIPVIIYFAVINKYTVNIPFNDDYDAILGFLTKFKNATGVDKIGLLFSQHGDHRIFHSRIVYVVYYFIFGKINFVHIIFLANVQLVVIFVILIHFIKKAIPKYWNIVSLVTGFCLFDLSSFENADFAMCGMQNYGVIMLFFISLYFYSLPGKKNIFLGGLFEAICIFSSGNGVICAACLTAFLILNRGKVGSLVSGAILLACGALYYFHYTKSTAVGSVSEIFTSARDTRFFFHMIGSHFSYENGIEAGVCMFILLIALIPVNMKFVFKQGTLPFICILGVLLGTIVTISVFRSGAGEIASYWSRYIIYAHIIASILFIFLWIKLDGKKLFWYLMASAAIVLLFAYKSNFDYGDTNLALMKKRLEYTPYYYFANGHSNEEIEKAKAIEAAACKEGIYCIQDER